MNLNAFKKPGIVSLILFCLITINLTKCASTAKLSDLPQSSANVDFDKYSKEFIASKTPFWTSKSSNEYYFEANFIVSEDHLMTAIRQGLNSNDYSIKFASIENKCVIGERGMRANEWNSITGVYYRLDGMNAKIFVKTKITQDITGGWRENRAMKVGKAIKKNIEGK